ncbi:type II secretion system protein N [Sphingomonas sp.]|jgi:general secretion pathway protein N|uniref:type II secretion system protein N n=1 Tax=Sphingomonas sp. TaxID=28214 RepID=UPI00260841D4|nr:type II secretion system protein N [Sphingomonas sp.]MDF2494657.1 type secretion system protein [Sphingomonas sp.]
MKRIRLKTGPNALFLAMFVVALIVFLPLRLALGWFGLAEQGLTARSVSGSIWSGHLREARFGQIALGDLSAGVSPLPLLLGRARVELDGAAIPPAPRLSGAIAVSRHSFALDDLTASLPVGTAFRPVPVTVLDLEQVSVRFNGDQCDSAEGRVRATLTGDIGGLPVPATLTGNARCDGGALLLPLVSAAGNEGSTIRLWPDGRYRAELTLQPSDPAAAMRLQTAGFVQTDTGMELAIEGRF